MEAMVAFLSSHTGVVLQALILCGVYSVFHYVKCTSVTLRDLQRDMKDNNEKFKDYVNNEKCEYHRKLIESHMSMTDAKLREFASQCKKKCSSSCKNKKTENI